MLSFLRCEKEMILIVAECNVNELNVNEEKDIKFILIVAECNVNPVPCQSLHILSMILIVAECNVNALIAALPTGSL